MVRPMTARIAAEAGSPEPMADQCDVRAAGREGFGREGVTNCGTDAERLHEAVGDPRARKGFGMITPEQVEHVEIPGDRVLDHVAQGGPVEPFHLRRCGLTGRSVANQIEPLRRRIRQLLEQVGLHHGGRGRAERHPEGQGSDRADGEPAGLQQRAAGEAEVGERNRNPT